MRLPHIVLRLGPLLLLIGLTLFAINPASHNPAGVLQLFLFSLFMSVGFLIYAGRYFEAGDGDASSPA